MGTRRTAVIESQHRPTTAIPIFTRQEGMWKRLLRSEAVRAQSGRCIYCLDRISELNRTATADHIDPQARGGKTAVGNIAAACRPCNLAKGAMPVDAFKRAIRRPQDKHRIAVWLAYFRLRVNVRTDEACARILRQVGLS